MILKNAGLKSKEEAMHRMIDGEVFYDGLETRFLHTMEGTLSAFVIKYFDGEQNNIKGYWEMIGDWQTGIKWQDTLEDGPVLCWVSDIDGSRRTYPH